MTDRQLSGLIVEADLSGDHRAVSGVAVEADLQGASRAISQVVVEAEITTLRYTGAVGASVDLKPVAPPTRQTGGVGISVDLGRPPGWAGVPVSAQFRKTSARSVAASAVFMQPGRVYESRVQAEPSLFAFYKLQENAATTVYTFSNAAGSPTASA